MTVLCKSGTITTPVATGNFAVTGIGFQPKAVIFMLTMRRTADAVQSFGGAAAVIGFGYSSGAGAGNNYCHFSHIEGAADHAANYSSITHCIAGKLTYSGLNQMSASVNSLDADGFTLNFDVALIAFKVDFIAIGGTEVTNAKVFKVDDPSVAGSVSLTGLSFKPTMVLMGLSFLGTTDEVDATNTSSRPAFGMFTETTQIALCAGWDCLNTVGANGSCLRNDSVAMYMVNTDTTIRNRATLTSMNSDGFTMNFVNASVNTRRWGIAIGGPFLAQAGYITEPSVAGTVTVSTPFQPSGAILLSQGKAATTSVISSSSGAANVEVPLTTGLWAASGGHFTNAETERYQTTPTMWDSVKHSITAFETINATGAATAPVVSSMNLNSSSYGALAANYATVTGSNLAVAYLTFGSAVPPPGAGKYGRRTKHRMAFAA